MENHEQLNYVEFAAKDLISIAVTLWIKLLLTQTDFMASKSNKVLSAVTFKPFQVTISLLNVRFSERTTLYLLRHRGQNSDAK